MEAFPNRTEKVTEVAKVLLKEIIPRFRLPHHLQSDNEPSFIAKKSHNRFRRLWELSATSIRPEDLNP